MIVSWSSYAESYLLLIMGPMGSGKSTLAVQCATHYHDRSYSTLFVNSIKDDRSTSGGTEGKFTSHNTSNRHINENIVCMKVGTLSEIDVSSYQVIVVDESQFFTDLVDVVNAWLQLSKMIIIVGLDGNYHCEKFGNIIDLIPIADNYYKVLAKCAYCGSDAPFSSRVNGNDHGAKHVMTGGWVSVCRTHHKLLRRL